MTIIIFGVRGEAHTKVSMNRFDKLNSYFIEKERSRLDAVTKDAKSGLPEMSEAEIKLSCLENGESS